MADNQDNSNETVPASEIIKESTTDSPTQELGSIRFGASPALRERLLPKRVGSTESVGRTTSRSKTTIDIHDFNRIHEFYTPLPGTFQELDKNLEKILEKNKKWAEHVEKLRPDFFKNIAKEQHPKIVWFGCSDSRVPAETIVQLGPGDIFVHRNIANQFNHIDLNCLSVLQYAVEHLKVEHVIVCGHYGCGGVSASMEKHRCGIVDHWLLGIKDVYRSNRPAIDALETPEERAALLVELNVKRQVCNIATSSIVQLAWAAGRKLDIHGWVYDLNTGQLKDLCHNIGQQSELPDEIYNIQFGGFLEKMEGLNMFS